jgi:sarcosine oxidase subunit alpha
VTSFEFEGQNIDFREGDTVASALYRAGVRVFTRSFKYHRPRGLYCLSGDCPNCLVNVDGEPAVRACVTDAGDVRQVRREGGWPSPDRDAFAALDHLHALLPVGFYYKTMVKPRWLWPRAEPIVRKLTGLGAIPPESGREHREVRHLHPDVLVIGGGVAGLSAALAAAEAGRSVVLCDEGRVGEKLPAGRTRERVTELARAARHAPGVRILERSPAIGVYEGPLAVLNGESFLQIVHPDSIVVATGALEEHAVFPGCDLPGVWLGRGAARLAGAHGVRPGNQAALVGTTGELTEHADVLRRAGVDVVVLGDCEIVKAQGRRSVKGIVVSRDGTTETHGCDAIVLSLGLVPRDDLARQSTGLATILAGDAAEPGSSLDEAASSGRRAGLGEGRAAPEEKLPSRASRGIVCLCEDVRVDELERAWDEGFRSTEILKRYTTATMGPCRGALCHRHVRAFVDSRPGSTGLGSGPMTARPPVRGITLEQVAAGEGHPIDHHTALHARHLELGAIMEPAGIWQRPERYGNVADEYRAVREAVSVMDVGTLGKYLVAGPDATEFVDRFFPCYVRDLEPGRFRYALTLGEHGYVVDDGIVCALEGGRWYVTFTSAGGATAEAIVRDWIETWDLEVHLVNLTVAWGAINVAGPRSRELLERLSNDPLDNKSFPYLRHREVVVAGVPCRAIRLGFVGELSFELHHDSTDSVKLWDALLESGDELGIRPHGLEALRLLRLEKGHVIIGQDTDYDSTPEKLNMPWAVKIDKPTFVGRSALLRMEGVAPDRRLVALRFDGNPPPEGAALTVDGRYVGYLTSSRRSPVLGYGVSLGWTVRVGGEFPSTFDSGGSVGTVVDHAFYDPEGGRLRA